MINTKKNNQTRHRWGWWFLIIIFNDMIDFDDDNELYDWLSVMTIILFIFNDDNFLYWLYRWR